MSVLEAILVRIFPHSDWIRIQSECGKIRTRITQNKDTFHAVIIMFSNKIECCLSFKFMVCFCFGVRIPSQSFLKDCDLKQKIRSTIMDLSIWITESKEIKQTWTEIKKVDICFEKLWSCCRFSHLKFVCGNETGYVSYVSMFQPHVENFLFTWSFSIKHCFIDIWQGFRHALVF